MGLLFLVLCKRLFTFESPYHKESRGDSGTRLTRKRKTIEVTEGEVTGGGGDTNLYDFGDDEIVHKVGLEAHGGRYKGRMSGRRTFSSHTAVRKQDWDGRPEMAVVRDLW